MLARLCMPVWCIAMALGAFSFAQEPEARPQQAEPVVVTVSAEQIPLAEVPGSVVVLTRAEIERSRTSSVVDLLRSVPFLHISQTGGRGGLSAVSIRGGDPNATLVLIDGVPVNDPTNLLGGAYDFSNLSTDQIERIEIVSGPISSLYGSEAMSGVIHILTKQGTGAPSYSVDLRAGNFDFIEARVGTQGSTGKFSYAIGASVSQSGEQVEGESFQLATGSFSGSINFSPKSVLNVNTRYMDSEAVGFPENGGGPEFSILRDLKLTESRDLVLGANYLHQLNGKWSYEIHGDHYDRHANVFTPAILDAIPPGPFSLPSFSNETNFRRTNLQSLTHWKSSLYAGAAGIGVKEESGESNGLIAEFLPSAFSLDRTTLFGTGELVYHSAGFLLSAGFRVDKSDGFAAEFSPRAGFSYQLGETRFKGSWGEGFHLPSFFALGEPNTGNPDLKPERSRGVDIGFEQQFNASRLLFSISFFHNRFEDLIDFSAEEFRLVNRNLAITQGAEFGLTARPIKQLRMQAHLNYVDAKLDDSNERLRDRPRWRGGVNLDAELKSGLETQFSWVSVGDRFDFQIPVPEFNVAEGYNLVNVAVSQRLIDRLKAFIRIENLFDNNYSEFVGFPNAGLSFQFGVRFSTNGEAETKAWKENQDKFGSERTKR